MSKKNSSKIDKPKKKHNLIKPIIGKVYKITDGELTYYGSTKNPYLSQRFAIHKCMYKKGGYKISVNKIFEKNKYNDFKNMKIELLNKIEIKTEDDIKALKIKENEYIKNNECVNINNAYISREEKLQKMRTDIKYRYHNDPEYREKKLKSYNDRYHNDPEYRERSNEYSRKYMINYKAKKWEAQQPEK